MTSSLNRLSQLITEAETRKKFLEQGAKALQETLDEVTAELQKLKASADEIQTPSAGSQTTDKQSKGLI